MAEFQQSLRVHGAVENEWMCVQPHCTAGGLAPPFHDQDPSQTASQTPPVHITCTLKEEKYHSLSPFTAKNITLFGNVSPQSFQLKWKLRQTLLM